MLSVNWPERVLSKLLYADDYPDVIEVITNDVLSKSKVDPCRVCRLRVKANSLLCVQCGKWFHGRCAGVKKVMAKFREILQAENVKGILERQWSRK